MSDNSKVIISPLLNYSKVEWYKPVYRWLKVTPKSGAGTVTILPTGNNMSEFEIAKNGCNIAEAVVSYHRLLLAIANLTPWISVTGCEFENLEFDSKNGVKTSNFNGFLANYVHLTNRVYSSKEESMQGDWDSLFFSDNSDRNSSSFMRGTCAQSGQTSSMHIGDRAILEPNYSYTPNAPNSNYTYHTNFPLKRIKNSISVTQKHYYGRIL